MGGSLYEEAGLQQWTRWNVFMLGRENTLFCCVLFLSGDHMSSLQSVFHLRFRETTGQILRNCVPETRLVFVLRHPFTLPLLRDKGKFRRRKSNRNFQHLLEACSQRHCVGVFGGEAAYLLVHPTPHLPSPHPISPPPRCSLCPSIWEEMIHYTVRRLN